MNKRIWIKKFTLMLILVALLAQSSSGASLLVYATEPTKPIEQEEENLATDASTAESSHTSTQAEEVIPQSNVATSSASAQLSANKANRKAIENSSFELYIDEESGNVKLVNKQTKTQWLGSPQLPSTIAPNHVKFIESPIHVRFTEGSDTTTTYSLKDNTTTWSIQIYEDYVAVDYQFAAEGLLIQVIYRLTERGLEVEIPYSSIKEEGKAKLTSIEVLPFFNAALETDNGAMLLPDGSGSLLHFRSNHEMYLKGYSEYIYGPDASFVTQNHDIVMNEYTRKLTNREQAALPIFGLYRNGVGSLAIVKDGQFEAKINGNPPGIRGIPIYRASVEFMYRKNDMIFIGNSGGIPYFQGQLIEGDRKFEFVLLEKEEANYVGMAKAYRQYLIEEQGLQSVIDKSKEPQLSLKLFSGIEREEIIGSTFIEMTTFSDAQKIVQQLKDAGVSSLQVTLDGWTKKGVYGTQPQHKVARQLGGKKGLASFIEWANEQSVSVYLRANYIKPSVESGKYSKRKDTVKGLDRQQVELTGYWPSDRWNKSSEQYHLIKPEKALAKLEDELEQYHSWQADGLQLQYMGNMIYSDEDKKYLTARKAAAEAWVSALQTTKGALGSAAVDYGNAYTFGYIDRIDNVPLTHSNFTYTDEAIPFYQLVIHGLIPYYAGAINLREDSKMERLKAIEYGALPSAELTYEASSELHRTAETRLFSSKASDWITEIAAEYELLNELLKEINGMQMVNHEKLEHNVYRTSYENGVQVIVNYNRYAVTVDGQTIEATQFAWIKG